MNSKYAISEKINHIKLNKIIVSKKVLKSLHDKDADVNKIITSFKNYLRLKKIHSKIRMVGGNEISVDQKYIIILNDLHTMFQEYLDYKSNPNSNKKLLDLKLMTYFDILKVHIQFLMKIIKSEIVLDESLIDREKIVENVKLYQQLIKDLKKIKENN